MKHTPGPWLISAQKTREDRSIILADKDALGNERPIVAYAEDFNRYDRDAEREANARLIAAAPEMLEALRSVIEIADGGDFGHVLTFESARALIAKVEGDD